MKLHELLLLSFSSLTLWGCYYQEDSVGYGTADDSQSGSYYDYIDDTEGVVGNQNSESSVVNEPNPFVLTSEDSLSTFGLDVDNASYTFHRSKLEMGYLPNPEAVRVEEFVNYFDYTYEDPTGADLFSISSSVVNSPFKDSVVNLVVGITSGQVITTTERKPWNFTMLVDVSGSMFEELSMVKASLRYLLAAMENGDKLSICTYAGSVSTVLEPTVVSDQNRKGIVESINALTAGGATAMGDGMTNAYSLNKSSFIQNGENRVIVCSDGDANIGTTSWQGILNAVQAYVDEGITMTTLGFGTGNYNDGNMEMLANKGNGNYYYIDSESEAERLFSEELTAIMTLVGKDARIQIDFDETAVQSYRLLGYENRAIDDDAFHSDTTDAGELGAGQTVTAVYELILTGGGTDLGTISLRYKNSDDESFLKEQIIGNSITEFGFAGNNSQQAIVVAEYAETLRKSPYTNTPFGNIITMAGELQRDSKVDELMSLMNIVNRLKEGE